VRLTIRPGGYDNPEKGWTGGYATLGTSGAVYLNAEYTVLEGARRGRRPDADDRRRPRQR